MKFLKKPFAPIKPPEARLAHAFYDAGQWCCDNLAVFMVTIPTAVLIAISIFFGS